MHFISFVGNNPNAIVIYHIDAAPNRPVYVRSVLQVYFNKVEVHLSSLVSHDEDDAQAKKFTISADGLYLCRFRFGNFFFLFF